MEATGIRYELRVGTLVSEAALATFRVPMTPTAVPRNTVYRLRVAADRDLSEVLHLLTERAVEVLEIRRCVERRPRKGGTAAAGPQQTQETAPGAVGVVVPLLRGTAHRSTAVAGNARSTAVHAARTMPRGRDVRTLLAYTPGLDPPDPERGSVGPRLDSEED